MFRAFWDLSAQHTIRDRVLRFWALSGVAEKLKLGTRSLQTPTRPGAPPAAALVGFTSLREFRPVLRYLPSDLRVVVDDGGKACVLRGFLKNNVKRSSQKGRATTAVI